MSPQNARRCSMTARRFSRLALVLSVLALVASMFVMTVAVSADSGAVYVATPVGQTTPVGVSCNWTNFVTSGYAYVAPASITTKYGITDPRAGWFDSSGRYCVYEAVYFVRRLGS